MLYVQKNYMNRALMFVQAQKQHRRVVTNDPIQEQQRSPTHLYTTCELRIVSTVEHLQSI